MTFKLQTTQKNNTIFVEKNHTIYTLEKKLQSLEEFSDRDYYSDVIRQQLVKKLELKNNYWKKFTEEIFEMIKSFGFVIVKELPFDENDRLSVGLCSLIGTPIEPYQRKDTHMVRKQTPGEVAYDQDVYPHTDGAHWPHPNDFTSLQCIRKDTDGNGLSSIIPIDVLIERLEEEGKGALIKSFYNKKFPFKLHNDFGDQGFHYQYILTRSRHRQEGPHVRFAARYIEECVKNFQIELDAPQTEQILFFEKLVKEIGVHKQFMLTEGDWLIFDNKRVLHFRSAAPRTSKRLHKKMKINVDRKKLYN